MIKSKWLLLDTDLAPQQVLQALLRVRFDMEIGRGFEPLYGSDSLVQCRFIEKIVSSERIVDPFGEVTDFQTVRYSSIIFRLHLANLSSAKYRLEISAPPRTVRPLVGALSEALDRIAISEVEWPILEIYKRVKKNSPRARIVRLKAAGISISDSSEVKVEVSSISDAYNDFRGIFPKASGLVEKIRIERAFLEAPGFLELSVNGLCYFDEFSEDLVRGLILSVG